MVSPISLDIAAGIVILQDLFMQPVILLGFHGCSLPFVMVPACGALPLCAVLCRCNPIPDFCVLDMAFGGHLALLWEWSFLCKHYFFSWRKKKSLLKTHLSRHLICLNMWPYTYFPQCLQVRIPRILSVCYTGFYRLFPAAMESRTNTLHFKWHQNDAILILPLPYFHFCCCDKSTDND